MLPTIVKWDSDGAERTYTLSKLERAPYKASPASGSGRTLMRSALVTKVLESGPGESWSLNAGG